MAHGFNTGGRQVGTSHRNRTALRERLASKFSDYDPPIAFTEIALDANNDWNVRIDCHKTIAAYAHPKIRTSAPAEQMDSNVVINTINPHGDH
ncbi:MAG: hypothetical protein ACI9R8_001522 [Candidatus Paceibacteria bacterium]|jgi:hypothetical protein